MVFPDNQSPVFFRDGAGPAGLGFVPLRHAEEDVTTTLYDERLQADLDVIRSRLRDVGKNVENNLRHAVKAVVELDRRLANETIIKDRAVGISFLSSHRGLASY